ncbi:hypothetical protein P152DRAFT_51797 [Eremomyces bilateralis CBS 781.70]|uniref:Uncharacterized protein n=1 Tax=Eremomyces bilateralis CBS 781.70 TaxID=1392243 RepID=A0A6G1G1A4_9PEZI|nr:uncharacterized protein P152DRAFT_51797 [Eremomyces bilateralis CBS 781.70]KAF1811798.1 hypothetical protein P152DRAFT_51797 [Eremomyces bilateralis CBS 781.70]
MGYKIWIAAGENVNGNPTTPWIMPNFVQNIDRPIEGGKSPLNSLDLELKAKIGIINSSHTVSIIVRARGVAILVLWAAIPPTGGLAPPTSGCFPSRSAAATERCRLLIIFIPGIIKPSWSPISAARPVRCTGDCHPGVWPRVTVIHTDLVRACSSRLIFPTEEVCDVLIEAFSDLCNFLEMLFSQDKSLFFAFGGIRVFQIT